MSGYQKVKIPCQDLTEWVNELFMAAGLDAADAALSTDNLVTADLRGVYSHGCMRVPIYVKRLRLNVTDPKAKPEVVRSVGATAVMQGNNAMGQVVGVHAMKLAIDKAKDYGVGFVSVGGSNHYGAAAHFSMMALPENMIGSTGTIGATLIMAPWGGIEPLLGNNPFSTAIPALHKDPVVLDMAQSVVARGKVVMAMKTKQPIPKSWALAADGTPTTDAEKAYWGTMRPVGDHKGYGLTLVTGLLSAMLSNSSFGRDVTDLYEEFTKAQNVGHYMQAVNIAAFIDPDEFKARVDEAIDLMHSSKKAAGVEEIFVPGELEARAERKQRAEGVEYPEAVMQELVALSAELGVKARF